MVCLSPTAPASDPEPRWGTRPLNDSLIVDFLVQVTRSSASPLDWRENAEGGFSAKVNGVGVNLNVSHSLGGPRLFVSLHFQGEEVHVAEPVSTALIGWRSGEEEQRLMSETMHLLMRLAIQQCAERRKRSGERGEQIRREIYRRLLFGVE